MTIFYFKNTHPIVNKFSSYTLFFIVAQQAIVAASTYTIALIGYKIGKNESVLCLLLIFIVLLFIVYIPGTISLYFLEKSKLYALKKYINSIVQKIAGKTALFNDQTAKDDLMPWLVGEAQTTINTSLMHFYDLIATFLNIVLNISVIIVVISPYFLIGYGMSIVISVICISQTAKHIQKYTYENVEAHKKFRNVLLKIWDNVTLGNQHNQQLWQYLFIKNWQQLSRQDIRLEVSTQFIASCTMCLSLLPIVGCIYYISRHQVALLPALVVTLPRQVQIIQSYYQVISLLIATKKYLSKLKKLATTTQLVPIPNLITHIQWAKILINGKPYTPATLFTALNAAGRYTLQGPNGVGKSCLLLWLKQQWGTAAFYLPTHIHNLLFNHTQGLSSGQKMIAALQAITQFQDSFQVLLLDEWDANLDAINLKRIDAVIEQLAKNKKIIEVRHRQ